MKISALVLLFFSSLTLWARLGETESQIEERYGKGTVVKNPKETGLAKQYTASGYAVRVVFIDGKSAYEAFKHTNDSPLTLDEINRLLDINKSGSVWIEKDDSITTTIISWVRLDDMAKAWTFDKPPTLIIAARIYAETQLSTLRQTEQKQKEEMQKRLQIF
ncbi:MAG: hypothetical protein PHV34_16115 [Verrucomicrobiae bacterium]|nr:hypothetical protein [Verrucomicrobiae bacterium]